MPFSKRPSIPGETHRILGVPMQAFFPLKANFLIGRSLNTNASAYGCAPGTLSRYWRQLPDSSFTTALPAA